MNRKVFHNSKLKATLTLCVIVIIMVVMFGCSANMGVKPISAMPETFWQNKGTAQVSVTVGVSKIGDIKGGINKGDTVLQGIIWGGVGLVLTGFSRYEDEEFYPHVQELLHLRNFFPHEYALMIVRHKLSLPSNLKPYYHSEGSYQQADHQDRKSDLPARDADIIVSIGLSFEDTTADLSLSEPTIRLRGMMHYWVVDEKTQQRIHQSRPPKTAWSDYLDGMYGTYNSFPTLNTESYPKSTWLSEDGRILEQHIKNIIERLLSQACQDINDSFK